MCKWYVRDMYVICTWYVRDMYAMCTWYVRDMYVIWLMLTCTPPESPSLMSQYQSPPTPPPPPLHPTTTTTRTLARGPYVGDGVYRVHCKLSNIHHITCPIWCIYYHVSNINIITCPIYTLSRAQYIPYHVSNIYPITCPIYIPYHVSKTRHVLPWDTVLPCIIVVVVGALLEFQFNAIFTRL